ncbi:hypothetical protein Pyn_13823 [Prunus yedoensis var. nudiflora]|uniref:Uncharacterized protein n=1 Tax=Prunus yedoensis var. nudiflora TaxID=2094558 RepID=A0A314UN20_PRUYE|nr:hypothetical protein Pyn_13823 [Prunus yedoensis var. nudiflora]
MAMRTSSKKEPKKLMELNPPQQNLVHYNKQYWFKQKAAAAAAASVIPAKRRSVKRMILDDFLQFCSSLFKTNNAKSTQTPRRRSATRFYPTPTF